MKIKNLLSVLFAVVLACIALPMTVGAASYETMKLKSLHRPTQ
jgi:hypothetical protein